MEWVDGERLRTVADNITTGTTITGPSSTQSPSDTQQLSDRRRSGAQASTSGGGGGAAVRKGSSEDLTLVEVRDVFVCVYVCFARICVWVHKRVMAEQRIVVSCVHVCVRVCAGGCAVFTGANVGAGLLSR